MLRHRVVAILFSGGVLAISLGGAYGLANGAAWMWLPFVVLAGVGAWAGFA